MSFLALGGLSMLPGIGSALATTIGGPGSSQAAGILNMLNPMSMIGGMMGGGTSTQSSSSSSIETILIDTLEFGGLALVVGLVVYVAVKPKS